MALSDFGQKITEISGIVSLMEDLGEALNVNPDILFMGGGNPARIPAVESLLEEQLSAIVKDHCGVYKLLGGYQSPQGDELLLRTLADYLSQVHNWPVSAKNIAVANGSQAAFFVLFNLFAGRNNGLGVQKILLPLMPEYLGYRGQGLERDMFCSLRPTIELCDDGFFKYHIDFEGLEAIENIAALCISRPTNPSGNLVSIEDLQRLNQFAKGRNAPLIVDVAYGQPFPAVVFDEDPGFWDENLIYVLSLSKLGLPGARTGFVVAHEDVVQHFVSANTVMSLACGNLGPVLFERLLQQNKLDSVCKNMVQPFYEQRKTQALTLLQNALDGLPYRIHKPEGAFFLWLWLENLPVSTQVLYERLKQRNVLIMAGEHFFYGLDKPWKHSQECIRLTYCQDPKVMEQAIAILADELRSILSY